MSILYFIIAIGVLILVHELGHFIVAVRNKIRVENFSIGFGPKIIGFKRGETEYKIAPIPLGGYIKMTGEDPDEEGAMTDPRSFAQKSVWTRIKVVAAGPLTNILFAFIFMVAVFLIGRMEPAYLMEEPVIMGVKTGSPADKAGLEKGDKILSINGKKMGTWDDVQKSIIISTGQTLDIKIARGDKTEDKKALVETMPELKAGYIGIEPMFFIGDTAKIDQVTPGGPADKAGLKKGDKIISINDKKIDGWTDMARMIHDSDGALQRVTVDRDGEMMSVSVTPVFNKDAGKYVIGIVKGIKPDDVPMVKRKYGIVDAVKNGVEECYKLIGLTFAVLKKLFTLQLSYKALGGPIQIAQASAVAAKYGLAEFVYFMAFLSIQLGILNLLPIPVLDGGHIVFCVIEGIRKKPLSNKVKGVAQYIGLGLLLSLFLFITINDIDSVWGFKNIIAKITSLVQ